ncbi:UDP-N-acetylmuramoyl-tripeptide--D-alanyl-D-alanine ligase [Neobacillus thermocopriae]|uniref:UDP-N-acetylmuramoyl-tripeptide--D-alanyl-D-alanine ligase n=1 Tax=Neobacillus thermocopriae TaxID=1215031 RepID=A0A6B3TU77_9BACI|nr:UDP-N-acetylmuramoyl-tripeptide--D-alanyl-D-alanine ligase [Neobacillus thermocopriae]MED3622899.1 UDP-N-acetylmuramoyl-tripeptide--D-alanyl-D-alanine ligase [Neobacillus thermocopriae]MED3713173.1 UDP-N-acetylmuramoyl-tripeptide--D-alanyl-D-alanine ligase [Neobacillus thermocopriae]NEX79197.1 UDP-N-acetylmuramoyl-tripeptide--D-alanyl-D-alanine ligase [Neobacillus thermocopriae]
MIKRSLKQIAEMITVRNDFKSVEDVMINGVTIDSRKIEPGNLFVPLRGEHVDGHDYVEESIRKGAAAALWQKDVPNPPLHLPILIVDDCLKALQELARQYRKELPVKVVGITGSNGKTTTKDITAGLLSLQYKVQKTEGNFNNHIGLPLTVLGLEEDTEIAVLEMGMSGRGEIEFLTKLACPDVVIITNIGESHLLDLGSRESIAEAKLEILQGLKEDGLAILHGDEPLLMERIQMFKGKIQLKTFGRSESNDLYPTQITQLENGNSFTINATDTVFQLPILGTHNILNALAAMLAARYFSISFEKMNEGFRSMKLTNMRMELVEGSQGEKIINDAYNASPTSMMAAIELVANLHGYTKKILVLGDMLELGPEEEEYHHQIGLRLDRDKIDLLFTYGNLGKHIANGAKSVLGKQRIFAFTDKEALIKELKQHITPSTLILVKASRGMKLEEVVKGLQK